MDRTVHLPEFVLLVLTTITATAAGAAEWAVRTSKYSARVVFWIAGLSFWSLGIVWSSMPGIKVTKTDKGFAVTPANANLQFPAPTGEFASMLVPELRQRIKITVGNLHRFQQDFNKNFFDQNQKWPSEEKENAVLDKYIAQYDEQFSKITFSLASAALSKIGAVDGSEMSSEAREGGSIIYYGKFVGPHPAEQAAAFLEVLKNKLPP